MNKIYFKKGITLISLIITIVLILVLATITINVVINGGLFDYASNAINKTEIASEKEVVQKATIHAESSSKTGRVTEKEIQKALNNVANEGAVTAIDSGETIVVKFNESNRYYEIDNNGNIDGPKEFLKDEYAGDITKGGACDGSAERPYEIWCIEDLVNFSKLINNNEINNKCNVILMRTLNFKSIFSYNDYEEKYTYNENTTSYIKDENSTTTLMELCTSNFGFIPIGTDASSVMSRFCGNFDGQGFEIQNIYINTSRNAGIFGGTYQASIRDFGITGEVISLEGYAGGIVGNGQVTSFYKCYNKADVKGKKNTGGIVGHGSWSAAVISECANFGKIISETGYCGGIVGTYAGEIINSYNKCSVETDGSRSGGIIGQAAGKINITNCYNTGNVESKKGISCGVIGDPYGGAVVNNCFNLGEISAPTMPTTLSYATAVGIGGTEANNCYNLATVKGLKTVKIIGANTVNKCYYSSDVASERVDVETGLVDVAEKTVEEFVGLLNSFVNDKGVYPEGWKKWKVGENGYPVFK